ncbi:MAG: ABC-2 transporter permease [Leptospiraceae bacterium]|nr:ABC-2 transporter permease [Leptospiraceae bacterium]MDW8306094.1 ABC-2 transporter permease [Leptospiraceae bacterium]
MKKNFETRHALVIARREVNNYFNTPVGYIFLAIFIFFVNILVFLRFWETGKNIQLLFESFHIPFLVFIPAVTMRLWAEEKKAGTTEILFTLPMSTIEIIVGKYISAMFLLILALSLTLPVVGIAVYAGSPDFMVIIGGYLGAIFMGGAYIALGQYISWLFAEQTVAFLVTTLVFFVLYATSFLSTMLFNVPALALVLGWLKDLMAFISVSWHYESLSRGIFDTRDILFFILFTALFLYLNWRSIEKSR